MKVDEKLRKRIFKIILVVSAHFEAVSGDFEISKANNPDMIFDYYGLPAEAYDAKCPAEGYPEFARKLETVLIRNNIKAKLVDHGFDHGVFVPVLLIRPQCDIPIVSMSINSQLDRKAHFDLGAVLAAFRDEAKLLICSGQSTPWCSLPGVERG